MNPWSMILIGWVAMATIMAALWTIQLRTGDPGIVDAAWAMGVGVLSLLFAIGSFDGSPARRTIIATLAMLWATRLSAHILWRCLTSERDGRYTSLKRQWGFTAQQRLFRLYQFQAAGSVLFALPMLIAAQNSSPLNIFDVLAIAIWCVALIGEVTADWQLARFRANPQNKGKVCREGLWKYSRHPNYFFEWLYWWTYVCLAASAPFGWLTIIGPLMMLYFILRVTGIPPTEAQALRSRGDAYREYQRTTSSFFPWPPRVARMPDRTVFL